VQFHPEFNADITKGYIEYMHEILIQENCDPASLIKRCKETPVGSQILKRFADFVGETTADPVKS
jgi:GMP synthase (glutamine-hydrolysing)